jgi:hypothetical protein
MTPALRDWIHESTGLDDFDLAAVLVNDLHVPATAQQDLAITFAAHDFTASFDRAQVIVSLEIWSRENLIYFQDWMASRCCKIQNYHIIVVGQPGMAGWWCRYAEIMDLRTFTIWEVLDLPFSGDAVRQSWPQLQPDHWFRERWYSDIDRAPDLDRTLHWHCVYLPGSSSQSVERGFYKDYLACRMMDLPGTLVDLRFPLKDADTLANWLDSESGWLDQASVDELRDLRQRWGDVHGPEVIYDSELYRRTLALYRHSFATVARESLMTQPWSCIGEKTLRPFMMAQFVIPTSIDSVSRLEDLGFWFDRDWFDFSYERHRDVLRRTQALMTSLRDLVSRDIADCQHHLRHHREKYQANSELARQLTSLYPE